MADPAPEPTREKTSDTAPVPRPSRGRSRWLVRLTLLALLMGAAVAGGGYLLWQEARKPFGAPGPVQVTIPPGTSAREAGVILERHGVVRHRLIVPVLVRLRYAVIKAGDYTFQRPLDPEELLRLLERGVPPPFVRVTVPEGYRIDQVAEVVLNEGLGSCEELLALARDPSGIRDLDPVAWDLEGYLHPDTYHLKRPATAADLVQAMLVRFHEVAARAKPALPVRTWVTLASLVEEETGLPEERPRVASVYWNRLRRGILLQCDPTIIYGFVAAGLPAREPMSADLAFDSPYNTYLRPGLPPGPISSPGAASLQAVLHPEETDFLFFVARGDEGHVFSKTLEEHNRAVGAYRRHKAAERREARRP